jgi:3-dehydroquinate synthase
VSGGLAGSGLASGRVSSESASAPGATVRLVYISERMTGEHDLRVKFAVPFQYAVHFTERAFEPDNRVFVDAIRRLEPGRRHRLFVVVDDGVERAHPELLRSLSHYCVAHAEALTLASEPIVVPGGERAKNDPALVNSLHERMGAIGLDRQSFCVAIGGGAVQDMVGFAAATCHRGVRMLRLPSTVLGQNDSGVGVKNGVNAFGMKNFVGSFAVPFAVINDFDLLRTLPRRDRVAGMAEAVKVALIRDAAFFEWLCEHASELGRLDAEPTRVMIRECARLHVEHIAGGGDPFEFGSSRPLDYGHWAAHKLESLTGHALRHGEAVGIGLALDSRYSVEAGLLAPAVGERITRLLTDLGFRLYDPALELRDRAGQLRVLEGLREFREHLGGELTISLLRAPGEPVNVHDMDFELVARCIGWLARRYRDAA